MVVPFKTLKKRKKKKKKEYNNYNSTLRLIMTEISTNLKSDRPETTFRSQFGIVKTELNHDIILWW